MTKIMFCGCEHEWQDKKYGKHMRLHNECVKQEKGKRATTKGFRCTVCNTVKS
jgi:hypothetical protein